jgi:hypothetical protein
MAQSYVTDAGTLIIPGAYSSIKVETSNSGLATTGVLMLVGEADAGPSYTLESDLQANSFGPDQLGLVVAKYKSGAIVDAFRAAVAPANDPNITGAPSRIVIAKTNASTKASLALGAWGTLQDKSYGKLGNLIYVSVGSSVAEVAPTTGEFIWVPQPTAVNAKFYANGAAVGGTTVVPTLTMPNAVATALNALTGISATGGTEKILLSANTQVVATASGAQLTLVAATAYAVAPAVGDTLVIPSGSVFAAANEGAYVVTSFSAAAKTIIATKLADASGAGGTVTNPVTETVANAGSDDLHAYSPITVAVDSGSVAGLGLSLEVAATDSTLARAIKTTAGANVSWISVTGAPKLITSASERKAKLNVNRQYDGIQEEIVAGGEIAIKLGYNGTSCSVVVNDSTMTFTASGAGDSFSLDLKDFPTLSDLVSFVGSKSNYVASVGLAVLGQLPATALDDGTYAIATAFGTVAPGRIKIDAYRLANAIASQSVLVELAAAPAAGLPAEASIKYLSGGLRGATTQAAVVAAIDALENVRGNFLVPLFSRDAAADILDGLTDSASTYAIDAINAYAKAHALKLSTLKRRRNRQAFVSKQASFTDQKEAAANLASFRTSMTFENVKNLASDGTIKTFQPWMASVVAAAMQAAGFYRAIVNKGANVSGVLHADGSFSDSNDSQIEDALVAGLLPIRRASTGGFTWVSDQTTYGKDANFVFNSIQAVYVADIIALTTAQRMEGAFVGQSIADVSAAAALSYLEGVMSDFFRLKLIAASDDAPRGYRNVLVQISGPTMKVSLEVKLAGAIYFIPISFLVSQVSQTAGA